MPHFAIDSFRPCSIGFCLNVEFFWEESESFQIMQSKENKASADIVFTEAFCEGLHGPFGYTYLTPSHFGYRTDLFPWRERCQGRALHLSNPAS